MGAVAPAPSAASPPPPTQKPNKRAMRTLGSSKKHAQKKHPALTSGCAAKGRLTAGPEAVLILDKGHRSATRRPARHTKNPSSMRSTRSRDAPVLPEMLRTARFTRTEGEGEGGFASDGRCGFLAAKGVLSERAHHTHRSDTHLAGGARNWELLEDVPQASCCGSYPISRRCLKGC